MAAAQTRTVYVTNTNQPVYRPQPAVAQPMTVCCSVGLIMFGVFLCFPGIILTATGASFVAGPLCLSVGIVLVVMGSVMCHRNQKAGITGNPMTGATITTTTVQQPYVVQQGGVAQNVPMQTNVHPTTTIYQAGQPQVATMYHQQGAQVPTPMPQGQGYPEPQITASYPPTNPSAPPGYPPTNSDYPSAAPSYPPVNPNYPPQGFSSAPPAYNDIVDKK